MASRWFLNPPVIVTFFISLTAAGLAGLVLLLLPSTAEIIGVMQWRMVTAKSFAFDLDAEYRGVRGKDGAAGQTKEYWHWNSTGRTAGQGDAADVEQRAALAVGEDASAPDFAGQLRTVGGESFLFLDRAPDKAGGFNIGAFTGQWLRLDIGRIREAYDIPFVGGGETDPKAAAAVREDLRRTPFFALVRRLPDDRVGGEKIHRYLVMPEKIFFKDFAEKSEAARLGRELTEGERQEFEKFFSYINADQSEIWIGADDLYLRRLRLSLRYDDGVRNGKLDLTAIFREFNSGAKIAAAPDQSRDVSAILERLAPGIIARLPLAKDGSQQRVAVEAKPTSGPVTLPGDADTDSDGLTDMMELFFGSDPHNPDTNGDGIKDGVSVDKGLNPAGAGKLFDFGLTGPR